MIERARAAVPAGRRPRRFAGHEHNFQLSRADGIDYFLSGRAASFARSRRTDFAAARTVAWSAQSHLLHVHLDGETMTVTPYAGLTTDGWPHPMTATTRTTGCWRCRSSWMLGERQSLYAVLEDHLAAIATPARSRPRSTDPRDGPRTPSCRHPRVNVVLRSGDEPLRW